MLPSSLKLYEATTSLTLDLTLTVMLSILSSFLFELILVPSSCHKTGVTQLAVNLPKIR